MQLNKVRYLLNTLKTKGSSAKGNVGIQGIHVTKERKVTKNEKNILPVARRIQAMRRKCLHVV